jgi:hypothetical protein
VPLVRKRGSSEMSWEKNFNDVQPEDVGAVLVAATETNKYQLGVDAVELAIKHGYDIVLDVWNEDKPTFLAGHATPDMLDDLSVVVDFAIQYLEEKLPEGFYLDADTKTGIVLRHEDYDLTLE